MAKVARPTRRARRAVDKGTAAALVIYTVTGSTALTCALILLTGWPRLLLTLFGIVLLLLPSGALAFYILTLLSRVFGGMRVLAGVGLVAAFALGMLLGTDAATVGAAAFAQDIGLVLIGFRPWPYPRRNVVGVLVLVALGSATSSAWILFG